MPRKGWRKPAGQREVRINLSKLKLPGPGIGGWVEPLAMPRDECEKLSKWLSDSEIARLFKNLEAARDCRQWSKEQPTLGEERAVLSAVAMLADALSFVLENQSQSGRAAIDGISLQERHDLSLRRIGYDCHVLKEGCLRLLDEQPTQSYQRADLFAIDCIAQVVCPAGIKLTEGSGSRFLKICKLVLPSIGFHCSPVAAIVAYKKEQESRSRSI